MAAARAPRPPVAHRRRSLAEKRHLVELALRPGASARAVALDHGVHQNTLGIWKREYRAGKLGAKTAKPRKDATQSTSFVPVSVASIARGRSDSTCCSGVVEVVFASGATLRIETEAIDAVLVSALVAELRR